MLDHEELLKKTYELAKSNNKILRRMRRAAWIGGIGKIIFWAVALGVPVYLYFNFFQPILGQLLDTVSQVQSTGTQIQKFGEGASSQLGELKNLLNKFPGVGE